MSALRSHLDTLLPDSVFTLSPDGEYGHPEHIIVGSAITELLLREGWVEQYPLYYFAWTQEQVADDPDLAEVDELIHRASADEANSYFFRRDFRLAQCSSESRLPKRVNRGGQPALPVV